MKIIELTREEREVLRMVLTGNNKDLKNYQKEAMWAGDIFGVEDAARKMKILNQILDKIKE
jgi:hypothetical protein